MMKFIGEYWRGEKPLWKAFWLIGIVYNIIVTLVAIVIALIIVFISGSELLGKAVALLAYLALYFWWLVSVWRCAKNSAALWSLLARLVVFCSAITFVGMLIGFYKIAPIIYEKYREQTIQSEITSKPLQKPEVKPELNYDDLKVDEKGFREIPNPYIKDE